MAKRAAIYARVSKAYTEDDERVTIESQLTDCEEYCHKRGYTVVRQYVDKDKYRVKGALVHPSGARKDRPGYVKMLKAAAAGDFDVIVAWKEDRLYRGMYAALPLSEILDESHGAVTVDLVTETFDQKMLGIKAAIAKIELDNIRDRMVRGRRARLERGEVPGGPTRYGYVKEDKHLVIDESEARIVRQVFDWYNEGVSNMETRKRLATIGTPGRGGSKWTKTQIQHILTFEGYVTGEYTTDLDGQTYTIPCPPIIPMHVWERSLETRARNTVYRGRNVKEDYLTRGLVTCPCGTTWHARTCKAGRGSEIGKYGYYACAKLQYDPEGIHPDCPRTVGSLQVDRAVWDFMRRICERPDVIRQAIDDQLGLLQAEQDSITNEADRLQRELDKIQEERNWVITMARTGKITTEDMELQLAGLHFQALDLRKKHNEATAASVVKQQSEALKRWAETYLSDMNHGLERLSLPAAQLSQADREQLYEWLEAARFESKYDGDRDKALDWAMLEERRRVVRMLIRRVVVLKGTGRKRTIIPQVVLQIPYDFASLVYDHQSLTYIETFQKVADEA